MTDNKTCDKCRNDIQNGSIACGQILKAVRNGIPYEERPQGEWIMNKTSARGRNYTCTSCKKVSRNKFNFCPNCGADMRGGAE